MHTVKMLHIRCIFDDMLVFRFHLIRPKFEFPERSRQFPTKTVHNLTVLVPLGYGGDTAPLYDMVLYHGSRMGSIMCSDA